MNVTKIIPLFLALLFIPNVALADLTQNDKDTYQLCSTSANASKTQKDAILNAPSVEKICLNSANVLENRVVNTTDQVDKEKLQYLDSITFGLLAMSQYLQKKYFLAITDFQCASLGLNDVLSSNYTDDDLKENAQMHLKIMQPFMDDILTNHKDNQ